MGRIKKVVSSKNPSYYTKGGIELLHFWKAKLSFEEFKGFCKGNIIKYLIRADDKNGLEDYLKAQDYLNFLVGAYKEEKIKSELSHNSESD